MRRGVQLLTDPDTGFTCYAIAGGAGDDDGGSSEGTGTDGTRDGADGTDGDTSTGDSDDGNGDDGDGNPRRDRKASASDPDQLRADLARERKRRQDAERRSRELEQQGESEADTIRREAREQALEPARRMARRAAVSDTARDVGFVDPSDAFASLVADGTLDAVEVDDDRLEVVDPDAVRDELVKLAKRKPHLLTDDARARLEGRTASDTSGSSLDGRQGSGSGGKSPDDLFGAILAGRSRSRR